MKRALVNRQSELQVPQSVGSVVIENALYELCHYCLNTGLSVYTFEEEIRRNYEVYRDFLYRKYIHTLSTKYGLKFNIMLKSNYPELMSL